VDVIVVYQHLIVDINQEDYLLANLS